MGWVDNLDEELQTKSQNDQPSTSYRSPISEIDNLTPTPKLSEPPTEDRDDNEEKEKKEKDEVLAALRLFAERVTMAGVFETYKAKIPAEKCMWYLSMILICSFLIRILSNIIYEYQHARIVYDHFPMSDYQPPFPNLTLCSPTSINRSSFAQIVAIPEKTRRLMSRKNIKFEQVLEYWLDFWRYDRSLNKAESGVVQAAMQIMDATAVQFPLGVVDILYKVYLSCERMLSDCSFGGTKFDCCRAAQWNIYEDKHCYHISLSRIPELKNLPLLKGSEADDPTHIESTTFQFNATCDWSTAIEYENVFQNGFQLSVGPIMSGLSDPVAIPYGADAIVTLSATKHYQLTKCVSNNSLPKVENFDYYDPYGLFFATDTVLKSLVPLVGCDIPMLTHAPRPPNTTACMPGVFFGLKGMKQLDDMTQISFDKKSDAAKAVETITKAGEIIRNNIPICDRWEYKITTASYGYVHNRDQSQWDRDSYKYDNSTWSRVKVYFPSATYLLRIEKPRATPYMVLWYIGGVLTVYVGVSMIGIVQLTAYGIFIFYSIGVKCHRNRKRVYAENSADSDLVRKEIVVASIKIG